MTDRISVEDVAAMRQDGSLRQYLDFLASSRPKPAVKPQPAPLAAVPAPAYTVTHTGGWPLGTAATGPTPDPTRCSCVKCKPTAPVIPLVGTPPEADHDTTAA